MLTTFRHQQGHIHLLPLPTLLAWVTEGTEGKRKAYELQKEWALPNPGPAQTPVLWEVRWLATSDSYMGFIILFAKHAYARAPLCRVVSICTLCLLPWPTTDLPGEGNKT